MRFKKLIDRKLFLLKKKIKICVYTQKNAEIYFNNQSQNY